MSLVLLECGHYAYAKGYPETPASPSYICAICRGVRLTDVEKRRRDKLGIEGRGVIID